MAAEDEDRATLSPSRARFEALIPRQDRAPAIARARFGRWLEGEVSPRVRDDALLVLSELVTNSVRHANAASAAPVRVTAELSIHALRLEVADAGDGGAFARRAPDLRFGGGFGLQLVERLASRWGIAEAGGTVVWCELARA